MSAGFCHYSVPAGWKSGGMLLLGRDPGADEVRAGEPFVGRAGQVLNDHLRQAGINRDRCAILNVSRYRPYDNEFFRHDRAQLERELEYLRRTLHELKPGVIVALGNEASWVLVEDWPGDTIFGAKDVQLRRGYVWDSPYASIGVLTTVHPAAVDREWVPWSPLLAMDLRKAKELLESGHLRRPQREVEVVSSGHHAARAVAELRHYGALSCDIENYDEQRLACIGFAGRSDRAVVFPAAFLSEARRLLEDADLRLLFHNGMYDLYYLLTRCGIETRAKLEDTSLQWHCLAPELAGKAEGPKATARRNTQKRLAFLASLHTLDEWWKSYDFADDNEMFVLNGKDCCLTLDIWQIQREQLRELGVEAVYRSEIDLMWPLLRMQQRGVKIDEKLRLARLAEIEARLSGFKERLNALTLPLLAERAEMLDGKRRLFENVDGVCKCCRHAAKKQLACWSCAGYTAAPGKRQLQADGITLQTCKVCNGEQRKAWLEYNPNSNEQTKAILYDLLRLPARYEDGKPSANEAALKALLGIL